MSDPEQLALDWGEAPVRHQLEPAPAQPPAIFQHPQANREIRLPTCVVGYLFAHAKRRTIGLRISEQGLEVRAPRYCLVSEVQRVLNEKSTWIHDQLQRQRERQARVQQARIVWAEGGQVPYLGEVLSLRFSHGERVSQPVTWDGALPGVLRVALPPLAGEAQVRDAVQAWLKRQAFEHFTARLQHFAPLVGVAWQGMKLSSAKSRWGSADQRGQIRLNWKLIHATPELVDYVVVHELSHLREMNHSPRFWAVVSEVLPDFQQRIKALHAWHAPPS